MFGMDIAYIFLPLMFLTLWGNKMKKYLVFLAFGLLAGSANATIIDFESGSISSSGMYTEDGFNLMVNSYSGSNADLLPSYNPGNSTRIFAFCSFDSGCTNDTNLSFAGSTAFSISSLDAANFMAQRITGTIDLIGNFQGGGSITHTIITSNSWSSFSLSGFNNLSSLDIIGHTVYALDIDNLNISMRHLCLSQQH